MPGIATREVIRYSTMPQYTEFGGFWKQAGKVALYGPVVYGAKLYGKTVKKSAKRQEDAAQSALDAQVEVEKLRAASAQQTMSSMLPIMAVGIVGLLGMVVILTKKKRSRVSS